MHDILIIWQLISSCTSIDQTSGGLHICSYSNGCLGFIEGSDCPGSDYDECYGMILDKKASG